LDATIKTIESGLKADVAKVESDVLAEAARLRGLIHGA
jgi:hypothetical protein